MKVVIDAANISDGGGLSHLVETLGALDPQYHGIKEVVIWGSRRALDRLPARSWLTFRHDPWLDQSLIHRSLWKLTRLDHQIDSDTDVLFVPSGLYAGNFRPFVSMSQTLLPFDKCEIQRYHNISLRLKMQTLFRAQVFTFKRSDGLIFLTHRAKSEVEKQIGSLPEEKTTVVAHGVAPRFRRLPRKQLSLDQYSFEHPFRLLYVSTINEYKHQSKIVQAIANLRKEGFPLTIDFTGSNIPFSLKRFQEVLRQSDPQQIFTRYHQEVDYQNIHQTYAAADAFIFASTCEAFGLSLLEAMATGLPIACSNRSTMPETLGEAGIYFDPENIEETVAVLRRLLTDSELRKKCAQKAHQRASEYSWSKCARETFSFIAKIAGKEVQKRAA